MARVFVSGITASADNRHPHVPGSQVRVARAVPSLIPSPATSQAVVAEVFEIVMGAAGFVAGHAPDAAVDGLAFEAMADCLDFYDDVTAGEHGCAGAVAEPFDGVDDGISAAWLGSASFACSGGTVILGPWMVSWRCALCKGKSTNAL